jgi:ADP-heptose:LPS heptosyltransferase
MPAEAPPADGRFDEVLKIAVLRGGGLGDLLFALPALDALAEAYPEAEIVLLGTPMHAALLRGRPGPVARVEVLPKTRGVHGGRA